jgi:hypothetical protein
LTLLRFPSLARAGAAALLTAGVLLTEGVPALAGPSGTDLGLTLTGTTIAADAKGKFGSLTLTNLGTKRPAKVDITVDIAKLDLSKVDLELDPCARVGDEIQCGVADEFVPGAGATADLDLPFVRKEGATGAAGKVTVRVGTEGDVDAKNDSITAAVSVGGSGVDLQVIADDVYAVDVAGEQTDQPVKPGEVSALIGHVLNQGGMTARGIRVAVRLPAHTTFAQKIDACSYGADKRTASCTYDHDLIPADLDDTGTYLLAGVDVPLMVKVDADAPAGVTLRGGTFLAAALSSVPADPASVRSLRKRHADLPAGLRALTVPPLQDVDWSDNSDEFAVLVAPEESGGSGGGLPVTGPQSAVLGGGGLVVAAAGAMLFLLARRRRVVLVTPGDEKAPTA